MVVRYDGSVAPCCLNLVEAREHPFQFGDARTRPLTEIHDAFLRHPLLQLIRTLGFSELWAWLQEDDVGSNLPETPPDDACDLCSLLMRDRGVASHLAARAADPVIEAKVAMLASRLLGEHAMAAGLVDRWRDNPAARPHGFVGYEEYVAAVAEDAR
jgi:hypothetical protein